MKLLEINLPTQTSTQFANLECKNIWEQKIKNASNVYPSLEFNTVKHGVRPAMIAHGVDPRSIEHYSKNLAKDGLFILPLEKEPVSNGNGFSHKSGTYSGGPFTYRAVISKTLEDARTFVDAHNARDDIKIGELLGFPKASSEFFDTAWKSGYFDPIWQQAENTFNTEAVKNKKDFFDKDGNLEKKLIRIKEYKDAYKTLSVFRYIGVRVISHFPKSFADDESIIVANNWIQLAKDLNTFGLDDALDILNLPFEWDCSKGIAIVNTPVFKIVTSSMPCYPNHIIQKESSFYPKEAPGGIQFPWKFNGLSC